MGRPHVVIIGSGFGGIRAAKSLSRTDVEITIIDVNNFHTFQPLLYQVATAGLDADDIGFPIRGIFRRNRAIRFVLGEVTGIDLAGQVVTVGDGRRLTYDFLVIAAGTVSTSFGIEGVEANTFPLKTLHDALDAPRPFADQVRARQRAPWPPASTSASWSSEADPPGWRWPADSEN